MKTISLVLAGLLLLMVHNTAIAEEAVEPEAAAAEPEMVESMLPPPAFPTTGPEIGEVVVEDVYYFRKMEFEPPVEVAALPDRASASYKTPEEAFISLISAMYAGDYDWWRSSWSKPSQKMRTEEDAREGRTPEFWIQAWERGLKGGTVVLTHRVETGQYVILGHRLSFEDREGIQASHVFKLEDGRWAATHDLASDPVYWGWRDSGSRIIRNERPWNRDPEEIFTGVED